MSDIEIGEGKRLEGLYERVKEDPFDEGLWSETVELARREEEEGRNVSDYDCVPLGDTLRIKEEIEGEEGELAEYRILTEKSPLEGKTWYDLIMAPPHERLLQALAAEVGKGHWEVALDLGAGTGNTTEILTKGVQRVIAVDSSPDCAAFLREKFKGMKVEVLEGEIDKLLELGLEPGSVDLVL